MALTEQVNRIHKKLGSSPLILWILGALSLILWASGTIVQIQTSEYLVQNGATQKVGAIAYTLALQPWLMITGQAPIALVTSWLYAWVIELITMVFAMALAAAVAKISTVNAFMAKVFVVAGGILIVLNGWADFAASPGNNPLIQFLVAVAISIIVTLGLPLGIGLVEHGFEEL